MNKSIMEVVIEGAEDLHRAGLMSDSKLDEFKKRLFKNPEVKEEYDKLGKEFGLCKGNKQTTDGIEYQEQMRGEWKENNNLDSLKVKKALSILDQVADSEPMPGDEI
ncbi:hypothetical protein [Spartinivicinus ruber]|uniref:hypothetical protein n=1 Tax=Spartinivicinus ruber TaxID=2683272 RepID=UPI0013D3454A|nr:hypothetical protein [Spartinivicinus ruber]